MRVMGKFGSSYKLNAELIIRYLFDQFHHSNGTLNASQVLTELKDG